MRTVRLKLPTRSINWAADTLARSGIATAGESCLAMVPSRLIHDPPNAAPLAIAARMRQRHFVVADDPIVEIGDVQRAVGPQLQVDRPEPGIVADEKIFDLPPPWVTNRSTSAGRNGRGW